MWPIQYSDRLRAWHDLRAHASDLDLESAMHAINDWWWQAPMINQSLSWNTIDTWPGPWELLNHDSWCDLARALGMLYTIEMLQRQDIQDLNITQSDQGNLVQLNQGKYILNWAPRTLLNIQSCCARFNHSVSSDRFKKLLG